MLFYEKIIVEGIDKDATNNSEKKKKKTLNFKDQMKVCNVTFVI